MNLKNNNSIDFYQSFFLIVQFFNKYLGFKGNYKLLGQMKIFSVVLLYFLLTIPVAANDFYPSNVKPANGDKYSLGSPIPIQFDICLGYDYPAAAGEWRVDITIINPTGQEVYTETIEGFEANGPTCYPIISASNFNPTKAGTYTLYVETFYDQEINSENDLLTLQFFVSNKDLVLHSIILPKPMAEYYHRTDFLIKILVQNKGSVTISEGEYSIYALFEGGANIGEDYYEINVLFDKAPKIEPDAIIELSQWAKTPGRLIPVSDFNKFLNYSIIAEFDGDNDLSNNTLEGKNIKFLFSPIWPNEFSTTNGLPKSANNLANNDFVEFIVTDNFSDPELYSLSVYDSSGNEVESTTLDLFTVGETVDSFTVYSYEFSGDVLPDNHGAIALSYDSLRFSDYFISWGGPVTAVEGLWKDSTSTDIGITPAAGNSISLSGQGTDFSSFTWGISTPTPGSFNDSQLVPVEEQTTLVNQYRPDMGGVPALLPFPELISTEHIHYRMVPVRH